MPSRTLERIAVGRWGFAPGRVSYIPNGIDLARFADPLRKDRTDRPPEGEVLVGSVSVMRPEKNLARLLRAFAALPAELPARLVLVGDGPERSNSRHWPRRKELRAAWSSPATRDGPRSSCTS